MKKMATPVAEALDRAHAALLQDLQALEAAGRSDPKNSLKTLRARLDATRAHLVRHFRFEEEDGYMDAVREREPRLERAIKQVAGEHRQLLDSLDALRQEVGTASNVDETVAARVTAWIGKVREHEERENRLVHDAFSLDIGTKD